ncbi:hypothetical protein ACRAWF_05765 [Streptomyces sp. L7]
MSSPIHDESGAFGESGAPPNVYLPHVDAAVPSYDGYVDPAAAHGWQNAYDETRELPPVRDDGVAGAGAGAGAGVGRAELRRQGPGGRAGAWSPSAPWGPCPSPPSSSASPSPVPPPTDRRARAAGRVPRRVRRPVRRGRGSPPPVRPGVP